MCLTETWHHPGDYFALNEACPPGYTYLEKARVIGRAGYGGLAVIHRQELKLSPLPLPEQSSFECLAFRCKPPLSLTVLLIYRPPPQPKLVFFSEINDLLTTICATSAKVLVLGDINIHVDNPSCHSASEFLQLLDGLDLQQHVNGPTHKKGHTLDLVITNFTPINNLKVHIPNTSDTNTQVQNPNPPDTNTPDHPDLSDTNTPDHPDLSDHYFVSLELPFSSPCTKPKRQIQFRNLKSVNPDALALDLQQLLSSPLDFPSATESVDFYNKSLSDLLDLHAPLKCKTVSFSRSAPWYTSELREMKRSGRVLERRSKASGLTVHQQAYTEHQKAYSKSLRAARMQFYSNIINNSPGNSKQLFSTINHLLKPQAPSHTDATDEKCNDFIDFFSKKVDNIRSLLSNSPDLPVPTIEPQPEGAKPLCSFRNVTQREVEDIIKKMKPTTCALDPLPTALVKSNLSAISPLITQVINDSLQAGHVPPALKTAIIKPLLKKPTLDPEDLANYRPISNLSFISKALEKVVAAQLQDHLKQNNLYEQFQSGYRPGHSTETALLRVTNDLLMAADSDSPSLLILLDLTAAFDTVDHNILLHRLHSTIGLSDTVLNWFTSYLTDRTEYVTLGKAKSHIHHVTCGVPQGSVLGPTLFTLYMLPLGRILRKHGISFHCYADDTQLYIRIDISSSAPLSTLTTCLEEIEAWMKLNFLQLNCSKTEAILVGTPHQVRSSNITTITFSDQTTPLSTSVTNLGVTFDPHLTFENHIKQLCKKAFFHLRNISRLRPSLTFADAEKLVHAFVSSRLDYCNSLFIGINKYTLQRLQYIQNCAARILMRVRKYDHITPIMKSLHWLPVSSRVEFKVATLTHQCIYGNAPPYLKELLNLQTPSKLRTSETHLLQRNWTKKVTMGDRAFCSIAPKLWNNLPKDLRKPQSVEVFKRGLKTHLFRRYFC